MDENTASLTCPECGGPMTPGEKRDNGRCQYCEDAEQESPISVKAVPGVCCCERCDVGEELHGIVPSGAVPVQKDDEAEVFQSDFEAVKRVCEVLKCRAVAVYDPDWGCEQWYVLPEGS